MADEAFVTNHDSDIHYVTVADATGIPKGTLLVVSADPRTAIAHSALNQIPLGFTVSEKVANDGETRIGVRGRGIMEIVADGTITIGELVTVASVANRIIALPSVTISNGLLARVMGVALETASQNEQIPVLLRLF